MQTIGLIGGMSWHSTLNYYRVINELVAERGRRPRVGQGRRSSRSTSPRSATARSAATGPAAAALLAEAAQRCEQAGADVVLICTNLMHRVADDVQAAIDVPLLHIADALADRARASGLVAARRPRRPLGDGGGLLRRPARPRGPHRRRPGAADRADVDRIIFDELTLGRVRRVAGDVRRHHRPAPRLGIRGPRARLHRDRAAGPPGGLADTRSWTRCEPTPRPPSRLRSATTTRTIPRAPRPLRSRAACQPRFTARRRIPDVA